MRVPPALASISVQSPSVEAPALEAIPDEFRIRRLKAGASKVEGEGRGRRVEQRHVVGGEAPAERARILAQLLHRLGARDRQRSLADDPI